MADIRRVVVGTVAAFAENDVEFEKRDILATFAKHGAGVVTSKQPVLVPDNERLTRCEDDMIGIFGVDEIVGERV